MSLIAKLQNLYARYLSIDMVATVDYARKPGLHDVEGIASQYPEPKDDIERAYFQYLCSVFHLGRFKRLLINSAALLLLLPYFLKMRLAKVSFAEKADAVFLVADHISDAIIPDSLGERFPRTIRMRPGDAMCLDAGAAELLRDVIARTIGHPFFHLKVAVKLGFVVGAIERYQPKAIIHNSESSFACSILSFYCENKGIEYIGVMHGEYLVNPAHAFFRCTAFYVWDEHYRDMLSTIRCDSTQFVIEQAPCLSVPGYVPLTEKDFDYTFYLQKESRDEMRALAKSVDILTKKGKKVSVRPHPVCFDERLYVEEFGDDGLALLQDCSLAESLSRTKCAAARFSTVIYQAYLLGIPVVLDDVSNPDLMDYLYRADYIMLSKKHGLLSELLMGSDKDDEKSCT